MFAFFDDISVLIPLLCHRTKKTIRGHTKPTTPPTTPPVMAATGFAFRLDVIVGQGEAQGVELVGSMVVGEGLEEEGTEEAEGLGITSGGPEAHP
jgi:hypothetical protein